MHTANITFTSYHKLHNCFKILLLACAVFSLEIQIFKLKLMLFVQSSKVLVIPILVFCCKKEFYFLRFTPIFTFIILGIYYNWFSTIIIIISYRYLPFSSINSLSCVCIDWTCLEWNFSAIAISLSSRDWGVPIFSRSVFVVLISSSSLKNLGQTTWKDYP